MRFTESNGQFHYGVVFRVANTAHVVWLTTAEELSNDDANAALDDTAARVQEWVQNVLGLNGGDAFGFGVLVSGIRNNRLPSVYRRS